MAIQLVPALFVLFSLAAATTALTVTRVYSRRRYLAERARRLDYGAAFNNRKEHLR